MSKHVAMDAYIHERLTEILNERETYCDVLGISRKTTYGEIVHNLILLYDHIKNDMDVDINSYIDSLKIKLNNKKNNL